MFDCSTVWFAHTELLLNGYLFVCVVFQTVQTVRDGDLPKEGAPALHGLCEGERSALSAHLPHTGNERERERQGEGEDDPCLWSGHCSCDCADTHVFTAHYWLVG